MMKSENLSEQNSIKKINIAIIVFAAIGLLFGIYLLVMSILVNGQYNNDKGSSEISSIIKSSEGNEKVFSKSEAELSNNGYNINETIKYYINLYIIIFLCFACIIMLLNVLVILFSSIVIKRRNSGSMIFFCTKYSVFCLIISFITFNFINVILSILSIVKIRKQQFELV